MFCYWYFTLLNVVDMGLLELSLSSRMEKRDQKDSKWDEILDAKRVARSSCMSYWANSFNQSYTLDFQQINIHNVFLLFGQERTELHFWMCYSVDSGEAQRESWDNKHGIFLIGGRVKTLFRLWNQWLGKFIQIWGSTKFLNDVLFSHTLWPKVLVI